MRRHGPRSVIAPSAEIRAARCVSEPSLTSSLLQSCFQVVKMCMPSASVLGGILFACTLSRALAVDDAILRRPCDSCSDFRRAEAKRVLCWCRSWDRRWLMPLLRPVDCCRPTSAAVLPARRSPPRSSASLGNCGGPRLCSEMASPVLCRQDIARVKGPVASSSGRPCPLEGLDFDDDDFEPGGYRPRLLVFARIGLSSRK